MKKKLICLTMSILMLLSFVLTGCQTTTDDTEEDNTTDTSAKTITLWIPTSEETTEQAKALVSAQFTKLTKSLFKTNVILKFCAEDEYYEKLESAIQTNQEEILLQEEASKQLRMYLKAHKGEKTPQELTADFYAENPQYAKFQNTDEEADEDAPETEEETMINEYGIVETKYPDEKENQVDIFYISGYDWYMDWNEKEWLSSLSEELASSSKKLTSYISPALLNGVQIDGDVFAIPNNVPIGEYTYMMIDKSLFDEYYNKIDDVSTVLDLATFLNDMKNRNESNNLTSEDADYVVPLASTFEECLKMLVWYWELTYTDESVYETYYDEENDRNYVLKKQYTVEIEVEGKDGAESTTKKVTRTVDSVLENQLYKIDEEGRYVDKDGNVLGYRYVFDQEGSWVKDTKGNVSYDSSVTGGMYLVDEDGRTVTAENDRRVMVDGETSVDADGNPRPTYTYGYNEDPDFSILGTMKKDAEIRNRGEINMNFSSLFTDSEYRELYATLMNYSFEEYYGVPAEGQLAGVSFVKGDSRIKQEYEKNGVYVNPDNNREYYVVVAEYPEASEAELYGNMFAVYSGSAYLSRCMEVITRLNTDSELRNLLQYGILGQHYELNDDGTAHLLTSSEEDYGTYRMDIRKTGNCFIATPNEEDGPDVWVYAKMQNNDSLINPLLGFDFNTQLADSEYGLDVALIYHINQLSAEAKAAIDECANLTALEELMSNNEDGFQKIYASSAGDAKLTKALNANYDPEMPLGPEVVTQEPDTSGASPFTVYFSWLNQYGYAAKSTTSKN